MSKKLIISEEEKKRILELHESSTNNKNLVSEEKNNSVIQGDDLLSLYLSDALEMEPKSGSGDELKLNAGTTLKKIDAGTLVAKGIDYQLVNTYSGKVTKDLKGDVYYYCNTKQFKHSNDANNMYWGENFSEDVNFKFTSVCNQPIQNTQNPTQAPADDAALSKLNSVGLFQQALLDLGYAIGVVDSSFGPKTKNAIIAFQKDENLTQQNGQMDVDTAKMLSKRLADNFKEGSKKELQNKLESFTPTKTSEKPIIKQPLVNQYIEKIKTDLQLPKDTTQQDTLNALMAKLNEIPVRK